jgi:ClpP class serine protease
LRNGIADGRVVTGKDALAAKLIDQLGEVEDAYEKARELGKAAGAAIVRYEAPFKLGRLLRLLGKSDAHTTKIRSRSSLARCCRKLRPANFTTCRTFTRRSSPSLIFQSAVHVTADLRLDE